MDNKIKWIYNPKIIDYLPKSEYTENPEYLPPNKCGTYLILKTQVCQIKIFTIL